MAYRRHQLAALSGDDYNEALYEVMREEQEDAYEPPDEE